MNHLEKQILDIIEKRYNCKYIGKIKVTKLMQGYKLSLSLGSIDTLVIHISSDLDLEEDFLKYIEQELINRRLDRIKFFKGVMLNE